MDAQTHNFAWIQTADTALSVTQLEKPEDEAAVFCPSVLPVAAGLVGSKVRGPHGDPGQVCGERAHERAAEALRRPANLRYHRRHKHSRQAAEQRPDPEGYGGSACCFVRLLLRFYVERVFVSFSAAEPEEQRGASAIANGFISIRNVIHKCHCHCEEETQRPWTPSSLNAGRRSFQKGCRRTGHGFGMARTLQSENKNQEIRLKSHGYGRGYYDNSTPVLTLS
ncbi:hypothetical protein WMY93_032659 [Mugilogobius chulae]|uniref:Uncharacterized protein n=1 Tax=Mugilogobius chulae TaxID=88201 RepID=A0AAW0MJ51_9GOBI